MKEYFVIMIKENDTSNLKLLTEKLNAGFYVDDRIEVGRSTIITLQRRPETRRNTYSNIQSEGMEAVPSSIGMTVASGTDLPF